MIVHMNELPDDAIVETTGNVSTIMIGEYRLTCERRGEELVMYPNRSTKQREFLKMLGRIVD